VCAKIRAHAACELNVIDLLTLKVGVLSSVLFLCAFLIASAANSQAHHEEVKSSVYDDAYRPPLFLEANEVDWECNNGLPRGFRLGRVDDKICSALIIYSRYHAKSQCLSINYC